MGEGNVTMYVTKWWATRGILKLRGRYAGDLGKYFNAGYCFVKIGTDAFATQDEAEIYVRRAAERKRASLLKEADRMAKIELYGVAVVEGLK